MTHETHQPDEPRRQTFPWPVAYAVSFLAGGILLPAWTYYVWVEDNKATLRAGTPDNNPGLILVFAVAITLVVGAVGGLVMVGLAHLVATLSRFLRRRHARQPR